MDSQERRKDFCSISLGALLVLLFFFHRLDLPLLFLHHHQISTCRPSPPPKYQGGPSARVRPPTQNVVLHRRGPATHSIADISWPLPVGGPTDGRTDGRETPATPSPTHPGSSGNCNSSRRPTSYRPTTSLFLSLSSALPIKQPGKGESRFYGRAGVGAVSVVVDEEGEGGRRRH